MRYQKTLPDKRIFIDEVPHYICSLCGEYQTYDKMVQRDSAPYGVTRNCKECFNKVYNKKDKVRLRRSSEELREFELAQKEFRHINFWGVSQSDVQEVKEVMKRMGFDLEKPIWKQWHQRHDFSLPSERRTERE